MQQTASNFEPLMNVETAAQALCLHPKTLMRMAREHRIPAFRVGRYWLFRASVINSWLSDQLQCHQANFVA
jgi:excisionase family DNA binding protein